MGTERIERTVNEARDIDLRIMIAGRWSADGILEQGQ